MTEKRMYWVPTPLNGCSSAKPFSTYSLYKVLAAWVIACWTSSIFLNTVKIGLAELARYVPKALEVRASYPSVLTIFKAASIISAFVNFALGGMVCLSFLNQLF
nr:hypothetical protein [uncultured Acetatifactor sp.]